MCDVSGPDLDDCSKNGKKAAEAMSLSKEGKSVYYRLQDIVKSVVFGELSKNKAYTDNFTYVCLNFCTYKLSCKASIDCTSAFLWSPVLP